MTPAPRSLSPVFAIVAGALVTLLTACGGHADEAGREDASPDPDAAAIVLDPSATAAAGISVEPARSGRLPRTLDVPGTLELDPAQEARISAPAAGTIARVLATVGAPVQEGATLAIVRSTDVGEARAAWSAADARRQAALARRDRAKLLSADGVTSQAQLLDAEAELAEATGAAKAAAERLALYGVRGDGEGPDLALRSPIAGEVLEAAAIPGAWATPEQALFHVGNLDALVLVCAVPEASLADVATGEAVMFPVPGADPATATVESVASWIDPTSRTAILRARVPNAGHALHPNQLVTATITLAGDDDEPGILLPDEAVQRIGERDVVFLSPEPGRFVPHDVHVEARAGDRVRLGDGLAEGDPVVVAGAFALKGQLVKGALGDDDD